MNEVRDIKMKDVKHIVLKPADMVAPNHHIYRNGDTWWCHATLIFYGGTSERVSFGLGTKDVDRARVNRDKVFMAIKLAIKQNEERLKKKVK